MFLLKCVKQIALMGLLIFITSVSIPAWAYETCQLFFSNGALLSNVPLPVTEAEMTKGLSHRKDIGAGMLFSWKVAEPRIFWMRDTFAPLSIGFFDEAGMLFAIEDMAAETDDYHYSKLPAKDALELPLGHFQVRGLRIGDRLIGRDCR